uniref:PAQR3 n=1 Tax=Angiostrongylus cantonensis TaxID=6313 RepID=A0A0K0D2Y5_ANGCA
LVSFYVIPELLSSTPRLPNLVLYTGVTMLLLASSLAHLLHSRSLQDHVFWVLVDFSGIALFGCSIGLQRFSCASDMSFLGQMAFLLSLMLIGLVVQFFTNCYMLVSEPTWRWRLELKMATSLLLAIWVYVPLIQRYLVRF